MRFYTYIHTRADDGKVFYVGKGTGRRADRTEKRSAFWKNTAAKHGFLVNVCARFATEAEAFAHEMFLICCLRGMGAPLVNLTDGGEGTVGCVPTEETLRKRSAALRGKLRSDETKARMATAATGRKMSPQAIDKTRQANLGRTLSVAHREALSIQLIGRKQTAEVVEARAEKLRGKKRSPSFCAAVSARQLGKGLPDGATARAAAVNRGKVRDPAIAVKAWEARRRNAALQKAVCRA